MTVFLAAHPLVACGAFEPVAEDQVEFRLVSPRGAERTALFELVGRGLEGAPRAADGSTLISASSADTLWVLVAMDASGVVRFRMPAGTAGSVSTSRVLEVAGPDDRPRTATDGYGVEVVR